MNGPRAVDQDAIVALLDRALPEVYHYLLHRCGRRSLAEDLTSDTLLAAVQAVRRGAVTEPTTAWLVGIARHKLIDYWRSTEREERRLRLVSSEPTVVAEPGIDPGRAMEVLAELNPTQRAALTLRHVDGLSVAEVAALLGRSVTATETVLAHHGTAYDLNSGQLMTE